MASDAIAQRVTGQVRYAESNQPAFNVNVHCEGVGTNQIRQTDRNGKFLCTLGSPGNFTVRVDAPGYFQEQQAGMALDSYSSEYMFFRLRRNPAGGTPNSLGVINVSPSSPPIDPNVPTNARKEFDLGMEAVALNKPEKLKEAIEHFERAVGLYPKFLQSHVALGAAYMDLQQWDKAELSLKKAIDIEPKSANALFALGEVQLRQKKHQEAEKTLRQGLEVDQLSPQGHLTLARLYWDMALSTKDNASSRPLLEQSYEQTRKTLELSPNLPEAHLLKGNLLLRVGRAADAQHEFEDYLRLDPKGAFAEQARMTVDKIKKALASQPGKQP